MVLIITIFVKITPIDNISWSSISLFYDILTRLYTIVNDIQSGVLQLNNINFFETLDIALFFCQFFCIFYSYFLVLCDIIVSGGVSYG